MERRPDVHARPLNSLPRLVAAAVRLAWQAGRRELTVMLAMQAATVVLVIAEVLVARDLAGGLVASEHSAQTVSSLVPEIIGLVLLTAAIGVANAVQLQRQRILTELCMRHGEDRVLAVTSTVELAAFDDPDFHDLVERAGAAVQRLPGVITSLSGLLRATAGAVGAVAGLVTLEPLFAPAVLLVIAPASLAARQRGRVFHRFAQQITPNDRRRFYLGQVLRDRESAKEVRAYGLGGFLGARRAALWDERLEKLREVAGRQLVVTVVADLVASAILGGTLLAVVALTLSDDLSLATAGVVAITVVLLSQRLAVAASSTGNLSESALFIRDYLALVERPAEAAEGAGGAPPAAGLHVRAEHVTFAYAAARGPALRDVSLEIAPGQVVALVGENGSGKTTLAKLLAGLYPPAEGRVTWNDADAFGSARDAVAVVFQDFMRYALTAADNVGVGRANRLPDPEGVRAAAATAGADGVLERLPQGYETMLGPAFTGGTDISIGQWQRIALARAVYRDAPFVILDEPTAALDAQAEHDLFARIRELLVGRSVLLISHRFSSVREADRIHVMHDGAIVESGTHDELIAQGGRYAHMFGLQAAPYR